MISNEQMTTEYIRCYQDKTRIYFIENYFKTQDASVGAMVKFKLFPKQKEYLTNCTNYQNNIVLKPRQSGYSTVTAAFIAANLVFASEDAPEVCLLIANKLDMSKEDLKKIRTFFEQVPKWFLGPKYFNPDPKYIEPDTGINPNKRPIFKRVTLTEMELWNGSLLYARSSGPNASRGVSACSFLFFDEAAFIDRGDEVAASAIATTASVKNKHIFMVSTPNLKDKLYYKTYHDAELGNNDYKITYLKWYHDPRFNKNMKWWKENIILDENGEEKKSRIFELEETIDSDGSVNYNPERWIKMEGDGWKAISPWYIGYCNSINNDAVKIAQELEVSFIGSGNVAVDPNVVEIQKNKNVSEDYHTDMMFPEMRVWKEPVPGHQYILGCLPPTEMVMTDKGLKKIKEVDVLNDKLINEKGDYVTILNRQEYEVEKEGTNRVSLYYTPRKTTFTDEHPIMASLGTYKLNYRHKSKLYEMREKYMAFDFKFYKASELDERMWVRIPNIYKREIKPDIELPIDDKLYYNIGKFLGGGEIENQLILTFLKQQFIKDNEKFVPEWVKFVPISDKIELLRGWFDTNSEVKNETQCSLKIISYSLTLEVLEGIRDIILSMGIVCSIEWINIKTRPQDASKGNFSLTILRSYSIRFLKLLYTKESPKFKNFNPDTFVEKERSDLNIACFLSDDKEEIYIRVKRIMKEKYTGKVYNFECKTHTFMCHHLLTHNCDASRGDAGDNSSMEILDIDAVDEDNNHFIEQVAEFEGKMTGDIVGNLAFKYGKIYNDAFIVCDNIGGWGETITLTLLQMGYKNLYYEMIENKNYMIENSFSQFVPGEDGQLPGFHAKSARTYMISAFIQALTNDLLRIRSIRVISELETWVVKPTGKIEHASGCHDDTLTNLAMSVFVYENNFLKLKKQKDADAAVLKSFTSSLQVRQPEKSKMGEVSIHPSNNKHPMPFMIYTSRELTKKTSPLSWLGGDRRVTRYR
jgi:hypothetical protein